MSAVEKLKEQTGLAKKPITILEMLESMKPQIALALPKHLTPERMVRIAITCLRTNPKLADCEPQTILASVMLASQLGLEPGVLGQCFLIPFKGLCTLVPGWLGILDLVSRAGKATAWTGAVYEGDHFDWSLGDKPFVSHRPCGTEDKLTHVYAIARTKGSDFPIVEVWPIEKVWKHRNRFNKVGDRHYSYEHPEMYARKVALLQALKYVPRSIELATAFHLDATAEMGTQHLEITDVPALMSGNVVENVPSAESEVTQDAQVVVDEAQDTSEPSQSVQRVAAKILGVKKRTLVPKRLVIVTDNNGEWEMSCFHESLYPILDAGSGKLGIFEISTKRKGDRDFTNLEKIVELDGQQF